MPLGEVHLSEGETMATLTYDDESTREGYLAWSVVLMKRGLRPKTEIEIHGHIPRPQTKCGAALNAEAFGTSAMKSN